MEQKHALLGLIDDRDPSFEDVRKSLSYYGFEDIKGAWQNLNALAGEPRLKEILSGILEPLFDLLSRSPDPDMALRNFFRFSEAALDRSLLFSLLKENPTLLGLLVHIFGYSQYLSDILVRNPEYFLWIVEAGLKLKGREELLSELKETVVGRRTKEGAFNALRRFKRREILRIGARDILGISHIEEITAELSWLAEACLQAALEICEADLKSKHGAPMGADGKESGFAIIAMGKLGGEELNFSSDIDLMFVYEKDGETSGPAKISNYIYFTRLGEDILKAIGGMTDEGCCYRVDMRLRPEGMSGPLVRSLHDYEAYYEAFGETWERLALLKARPVAGDLVLGSLFLKLVEPFVYRRHLDCSTMTEIRRLKQRTEKEGSSLSRMHLKLGAGGIREVEFIVQTLQILSGAQRPDVKDANTLGALRRFSSAGLLDDEKARALSEAYAFLRKAEHRLQMFLDTQLYTLPGEQGEIKKLGMRMGYIKEGEFVAALKGHTSRVRGIFDTILPPQKEEEVVPPTLTDLTLKEYGFRDAGEAGKILQSIRASLRREGRLAFDSFLPELLGKLKTTANPGLSLVRTERFLSSTGAKETYLSVFQANPGSMRLLTSILGGSEYLSRLLIANPSLFDSLVSSGSLDRTKNRKEMEREMRSLIASSANWEEKLDIIRKFKRTETLRIGTRDLLDLSSGEALSSELTDLAEACLEVSLSYACEEASKVQGQLSPDVRFVLLGLGKLGERELNYASDLDIIAVYSQEGMTSGGEKPFPLYFFFPAVVEKLLEALSRQTSEGSAYALDLRLRPLGEKGPLAHSIDSLVEYLCSSARPWERQAYTKARPVAGDIPFGIEVVERIKEAIYSRPPEATDVHQMREKMIEELLSREPGSTNVKLGPGGIVDIEFIVQFLSLRRGKADTSVRKTGTLDAIDALSSKGYLKEEDAAALRSAYEFFRRVEMRLRIVQDLSLNALPSDPSALDDLGKRLGDKNEGAGERLLKELTLHADRVREVYRRVIGPLTK